MQRSPELEALVASWFEAATRGDAAVVDTLISANPGTTWVSRNPSAPKP